MPGEGNISMARKKQEAFKNDRKISKSRVSQNVEQERRLRSREDSKNVSLDIWDEKSMNSNDINCMLGI